MTTESSVTLGAAVRHGGMLAVHDALAAAAEALAVVDVAADDVVDVTSPDWR